MHRDEPSGFQVFENANRFVGTHMHMPECLWMISSNREQRDFRPASASNLFEAIEVGTVSCMVDLSSLVFENKSSVPSMMVSKRARSPMFAGRERHLPIPVTETLPPFQFHNSRKAKVMRQIAHTPWHDPDLWMRQPA